MERTGNNSPKNVCEKIYAAVSVRPAFQAIRRISYRPKVPLSSTPAKSSPQAPPVHSIKITRLKPDSPNLPQPIDKRSPNGGAHEVVPINFDYSNQLTPPNDKPKSCAPAKAASRKGSPEAAATKIEKGDKRTGVHIEDRFTDYINRTKIMIRSMSHVSGGDGGKSIAVGRNEKATEKDDFTGYIERARKKFRTNSSIGGGGGGRSNS